MLRQTILIATKWLEDNWILECIFVLWKELMRRKQNREVYGDIKTMLHYKNSGGYHFSVCFWNNYVSTTSFEVTADKFFLYNLLWRLMILKKWRKNTFNYGYILLIDRVKSICRIKIFSWHWNKRIMLMRILLIRNMS